MTALRTALFGLLLWIKYQSVQSQCWNGYSAGSWDAYGQSYSYPYGQYDQGYDYSATPTIYISTYPQTSNYDYYQQHYNTYPNDNQQPIVVVINGNDHDDDLYDVLNLVASLNNKPNNDPIYIPYPVPVSGYDSGSDYGYTDCGCRSCDCGCSKASCCDCGCNGDSNCGCSDCKKRRSKSKCNRNSGCGCSSSDCGCNKCIRHKNDRCCC